MAPADVESAADRMVEPDLFVVPPRPANTLPQILPTRLTWRPDAGHEPLHIDLEQYSGRSATRNTARCSSPSTGLRVRATAYCSHEATRHDISGHCARERRGARRAAWHLSGATASNARRVVRSRVEGHRPTPSRLYSSRDAGALEYAAGAGPARQSVIDDFRDFLQELVAGEIAFLVVGAHALSVHGVPRATGDLDVWIRPDVENATRLVTALRRFGAPTEDLGIAATDFTRPDVVAQLGVPPYRIDVLTSVSGVDFASAWADRVEAEIAGVRVPVLGRRAFVLNKRATGRTKDAADLEALGEG